MDLGAAALIAAGVVGSEVATGFVSAQPFVPEGLKTGPARIGLKAAVGIGTPMLLRRFIGPRVANLLMLGAGVGLIVDVYRTFVVPNVPGLSDYDELSAYTPAGAFPLGATDEFEQGYLGAAAEDRASFDED